ncbi:hypothetical protein Phum_PHUM243580 [Pediculus humanus corporis]|uniref:Uncharacterized protein n=1 Tax=Pediculus humanus subsp. corporis TaxID=121224 RepID=E0VJD7_PEDHC|nr:uncharacterized protein Phum_PHUM243580 [Pediculus humanus corporis]EEB13493.1 hypothetical protein Phum_PHUM243580 [Pediculus humanus corporis]
MVSPNDGRTVPNDKGAKMQTSLAAAPRVRTTEDHSKLKLPFPPTNNGLMMEVVSEFEQTDKSFWVPKN